MMQPAVVWIERKKGREGMGERKGGRGERGRREEKEMLERRKGERMLYEYI